MKNLVLVLTLLALIAFGTCCSAEYLTVNDAPDETVGPPPSGYFATLQAAVDKAAAGDEIGVGAGNYIEDVAISKPNLRIIGYDGSRVHGTITIKAPAVQITNLTVIDENRCVVLGPEAGKTRLFLNRLAVSSPNGIALEFAGAETRGTEIVENQFYTSGGMNPDTDSRGLKHNWKPFDRAEIGILVTGKSEADGPPLHIYHNRISGFRTGLAIEKETTGNALGVAIWKNRITGNTNGVKILASGCTIEDNNVARSTGTGLVCAGKGNVVVANRVVDSGAWGLNITNTNAHNNIIIRSLQGGIHADGTCLLAHNTLVGNGGWALGVGKEPDVRFVNNLVDHKGPAYEASGGIRREHNVYANGPTPAGTEQSAKSGKVAYRNPPTDDFRPMPDSAAVDAGILLEDIRRDADNAGRRVGRAPDAGAFEVGPVKASGRQWWVSPTGSDETGDGSRAKPFASVGKAAEKAEPDDRVYMLPGVYKARSAETDTDSRRTPTAGVYAGEQIITCAGAEGHPVRIMPAPGISRAGSLVKVFEAKKPLEMAEAKGGKVVVEGGSWILHNCVHLSIEGIEFRESPHNVIHLGNRSSHNAIRDCVFINCPTKTPEGRGWHAGITGSGPEADDNVIENNVFDRRPNTDYVYQESDAINPFEGAWSQRWIIRGNKFAGYQTLQLGSGGRPDYTTLGSPPTYHLIENNEFLEMNRAIHIKSSDNIFRRNYIHDLVPGYVSEWVGMMNRSGSRNVYDGNRVVGCPYAGLLILGDDNTAVNNTFENCETGVLVAYREFGASPAGFTRVLHNTFVNSLRAVQVEPKCSASVYNNLIYNSLDFQKTPPTAPTIVGEGSGVYPLEKLDWPLFSRFYYKEPGIIHAGHNLFWNAEPAYLRNYEGGHGDIYADPLFVDPAKGDYRLKTQSPARKAGRSLQVGHDATGKPRPQDHPDQGALQFSAP